MVGVVEVEKWVGEGERTLWGASEGTSGRRNQTNAIGDSRTAV